MITNFEDTEFELKKPSRIPRNSYEEIIYERINDLEITQYFYEDIKSKDDMRIDRRSSRRLIGNTRSSEKRKSVTDFILEKSILKDDGYKQDLKISIIKNDEKYQDEISKFEMNVKREKAEFQINDLNTIISYPGIINLTDYRIKFIFSDIKFLDRINLTKEFFLIPIFSIEKIEKSKDKNFPDQYTLNIFTKDNRHLQFQIMNDQPQFFYLLQEFVFPQDDKEYYRFALKYGKETKKLNVDNQNLNNTNHNGWLKYNLIKEFERQEVDFKNDKSRYRISKVNDNFEVCHSYPKNFVVPRFVSDEEIINASSFRTRGRIPILSYHYKENKCCLWRSSQPKPGLTHQRNSFDEKILRMAVDFSKKLIVFDARPYLNALANRLKGGGFELIDNYTKLEIRFCEIDNIHAVRSSLHKMYTLSTFPKLKENKKFFTDLEKTGWFEFISLTIKFSLEIATLIKQGNTILIHCSDGWDRSSQLASLSQLILDPFYRTIEGFIILIEKDWLSFGHQFAFRNGNYTKEMSENQRSQVFLQWLDMVHHLIYQFPQAFEFNMTFLLFIANNITSCLYGTFLFNNDKEREEFDAKHKTVSIWTDIFNKQIYINPFYTEVKEILNADYSYHKMRLWEEYFLQYSSENMKYSNFYINSKIEDIEIIQNQKEEIEKLNNVIKDLAALANTNKQTEHLSNSTINYLESLNTCQNVKSIDKIKVENYIDKN